MSECPISSDVLAELRGLDDSGDSSLLADLYGTFLKDADKQLASIRIAADGGDAGKLVLAAHSLKGAAGSLGAISISTICREIERGGKTGRTQVETSMLRQLEHEIERVRRWTYDCGFIRPPAGV